MLHLIDLDELVQKIKNSHVKEYMVEALRTYRVGAYRASVALTYSAVCVDIIEKIKDLSLQGDRLADQYNKELEEVIKSKDNDKIRKQLEFEKSLIRIAYEELDFVSHHESIQLDRLREDRNFAVHPNFQKDGRHTDISPELARNHIVNACNSLFIFPATRGSAVIQELENLVFGDSFPSDVKIVESLLFTEYRLGRAKVSVTKSFLTVLFKTLLANGSPELSHNKTLKICAAINAIYRKEYALAKEVATEKLPQLLERLDESKIKILFWIMGEVDFIEKHVTDSGTDKRLIEIINTLEPADIIKLGIAKLADKSHYIKLAFQKRIKVLGEIDAESYREWLSLIKNPNRSSSDLIEKPSKHLEFILKNSPASSLKDYAIKLFISSRFFDETYDFGKFILLPHARFFNKSDLQKIFEGILSNTGAYGSVNQIINAGFVVSELLKNLYDQLTFHADDEWKVFANKLLQVGTVDSVYLCEQIQEKVDEIPF